MTQARAEDRRAKLRKLGVSLLVGGLAGFAGASALMATIELGVLGTLNTSEVGALCVALVYLLMGVAVAIGAASPRLGSTYLNVEDADELREQKATLMPSAIGCVLMAVGLAALPLSQAGGILMPVSALVLFAATLGIATWLSVKVMHHADEFMRQVMREGAAASFYLAFTILGGWAVLAHLGFVTAPAMLDIVSLFYALTLVGCFWVIGRRGMLMR